MKFPKVTREDRVCIYSNACPRFTGNTYVACVAIRIIRSTLRHLKHNVKVIELSLIVSASAGSNGSHLEYIGIYSHVDWKRYAA